MSFRIRGLSPEPFRRFYGASNGDLAEFGVKRCIVDANPGFPDRIEVRDLQLGETALLLNYTHQPAETPFKSSHAIFVREGAETAYEGTDEIPALMAVRPLSFRAFDADHMMVDADVVSGTEAKALISRFFERADVAYIHAHAAKRGCYLARIDRG